MENKKITMEPNKSIIYLCYGKSDSRTLNHFHITLWNESYQKWETNHFWFNGTDKKTQIMRVVWLILNHSNKFKTYENIEYSYFQKYFFATS